MDIISEHRLSFASANYLGDGLIEVIADEGVEIGIAQLDELFSLFDRLAPRPAKRAMLGNRKNSYSFSFDAAAYAAKTEVVDAAAVLSHSRISVIAASVFKPLTFPFQVFTDRDEAISWLRLRISMKSDQLA